MKVYFFVLRTGERFNNVYGVEQLIERTAKPAGVPQKKISPREREEEKRQQMPAGKDKDNKRMQTGRDFIAPGLGLNDPEF